MRITSTKLVLILLTLFGASGVLATSPTVNDPKIPGTAATTITRGTTAQRPGSPLNGDIRYNTTTSKFEGYEGSTWKNIITGAGTGGAPQFTISSKSANFTANDGTGYYYRVTTSGGAVTATLPVSAGDGTVLKFKCLNSANNLTITRSSSDTINRANGTSETSTVLRSSAGVIELISVSGGWDET